MRYKKGKILIIVLALFSSLLAGFAYAESSALGNVVFVDAPKGTFDSFLRREDGQFYVRGTHQDDLWITTWVGLFTEQGEVVWTITSDTNARFSGFFELNDMIYVVANKTPTPLIDYVPNDPERAPFLLPVDQYGITGNPIALPNWINKATFLPLREGVIFYGKDYDDDSQFYRLAMYDESLTLLWETFESKASGRVDWYIACVPVKDGFLLMGPNYENQSIAIAKYDLQGILQWINDYQINAYPQDMQMYGDQMLVLAHRINAIGEMGAEFLFCVNNDGLILWEKQLTGNDGQITLNTITPAPNGYILTGSIKRDEKPPEVLFITLDADCSMLDTIDIPYMKDMSCQAEFDEFGNLYLFGLNSSSDRNTDWHIVYKPFTSDDAWLDKIL